MTKKKNTDKRFDFFLNYSLFFTDPSRRYGGIQPDQRLYQQLGAEHHPRHRAKSNGKHKPDAQRRII